MIIPTEIYKIAYSRYGKEYQLLMLIEECSEFIDALFDKKNCPMADIYKDEHINEELADIDIVLEQLKEDFHFVAIECPEKSVVSICCSVQKQICKTMEGRNKDNSLTISLGNLCWFIENNKKYFTMYEKYKEEKLKRLCDRLGLSKI